MTGVKMLLGARRLAPGTLVPRSVSGSCRVLRRSPWSAPFPPQPPPRLSPLCSAASLVLWRSQTPPWRTRPAYGYSPSRTGLPAQTPKRSPGSRAYCFSACLGSSTTPGPTSARDITPPAGVAFPLTDKRRRPVLSFRSSIAQPTDASVYASTCCLTAARARLEVRMESLLLSCRALSSPTTCRFIPAHSDPFSPLFHRPGRRWVIFLFGSMEIFLLLLWVVCGLGTLAVAPSVEEAVSERWLLASCLAPWASRGRSPFSKGGSVPIAFGT